MEDTKKYYVHKIKGKYVIDDKRIFEDFGEVMNEFIGTKEECEKWIKTHS